MISPAILIIAGGAVLPLLPRKIRSAAAIAIPLAALWIVFTLPDGSLMETSFLSYTLVLLKVDSLSRIFGVIFTIIAVAGGVFAYHLKETGQQSAALFYGGGAVGVAFAGDLFTLLFFTELMHGGQ